MDRGAWWASPWARKELDMTERLTLSFILFLCAVVSNDPLESSISLLKEMVEKALQTGL